jgi:hypothetical protein
MALPASLGTLSALQQLDLNRCKTLNDLLVSLGDL